jgi:hypothetical protein
LLLLLLLSQCLVDNRSANRYTGIVYHLSGVQIVILLLPGIVELVGLLRKGMLGLRRLQGIVLELLKHIVG